MKKHALIFMVILASLICQAQKFDVDTLLLSGPPESRINYVFLSDGYLKSDLNKFITDAEKVVQSLFSQSPFKEYKPYFNVFAVKVPSNESGAATSPSQPIDNYFGSTFNYAGIQRLLVPVKSGRVTAVLSQSFPLYDQVFVLVNSTTYGGSGGWIATSSVHYSASEIAIHEIGHSFSNLSDEYWAGSQYARESPNMTSINDEDAVKWKSWMGENGIGIYEHSGQGRGWYKPHSRCKMQFLGYPFCSVCTETISEKIMRLTKPYDVDSVFPNGNSTINIDSDTLFTLGLIKPTPNTLKVHWKLNGASISQKQELRISPSMLEQGKHTLKASILDTSAFSRKAGIETFRLYELTWLIERGVVISASDPTQRSLTLRVFPNPASNRIQVYAEDNTQVKIQDILDLSGKSFMYEGMATGNSISIESLPKGSYVLSLLVEGIPVNRSFQKQ